MNIIHESSGIEYHEPRKLAREISRAEATLLVEPSISVLNFSRLDLAQRCHKSDFLMCYTPRHYPRRWGAHLMADRLNARIWARELKKLLNGISPKMVLFDRPGYSARVKLLDENLSVYYAHCDYTVDIIGQRNQQIAFAERQMLHRVDLALAASNELAERFRQDGAKRVEVFPCAYNGDLFDGNRSYAEPESLRGLRRPRLLFSGHITGRIDFDGLVRTMESRPNWQLVMIGAISDGLSDELERSGRDPKVFEQLLSLKNVIYCGQVSLREVPPYIAACDVGLVPYCLSEFTRTSSPIKAFEYLGMGKPVVSTNIPAAIREDLEIFVSAEGSYVDATEAALAKVDGRSQLEARILSVASDTVEARAKQLSNLLVHQNS